MMGFRANWVKPLLFGLTSDSPTQHGPHEWADGDFFTCGNVIIKRDRDVNKRLSFIGNVMGKDGVKVNVFNRISQVYPVLRTRSETEIVG